MTARPLSAAEVALCRPLFGDAIAYDAVRVHRRRWWRFQPRDVVMAPDGHLWCHPEGSTWRPDYAAASRAMQGLFVHEMTHVWQAQRGGRWFLPLARHPFCRYAWRYVPGRPFGRYGLEQQAEIVRHVFLLLRGAAPPPGLPDLATSRALLPFAP
ncbi:vgr related protein [Sphingomonas morindae]|uniref:Vgr related protein n=1 Tax=Sphingomonas morindae TaxID=1541170 RepID=A0ABY4X8I3_9SPHN|nr:vgr related protein [Sphingomonas morindae]USI73224.1 vgr related protein [Sphingomonas morindae]